MHRPGLPGHHDTDVPAPDQFEAGAARGVQGRPVRSWHLSVRGLTVRLIGPADAERLIDDARTVQRFEQDEYLPYWAELWSSGLLLADYVAGQPVPKRDRGPLHALELGCGLGLVGVVAGLRGYRVTFSDYDADALAFAAENARRNGLRRFGVLRLDWRRPRAGPPVDVILAADVLYETRNLAPVADCIRTRLAPDGEALVVDPNRGTADAFESIARHSGLRVTTEDLQAADVDGRPIAGRLFRLRPKSAHVGGGGGAG